MNAPQKSRASQIFGSPGFWIVLVGAIFFGNIIRSVTATVPEPPKPLYGVPNFTLVDQTGEGFGTEQLRGKIWIANFIFTSCPTMCPELTTKMQRVKHRVRGMGNAVHLVSFSVDPERDTPDVLARYAVRYGASPTKWSFLTGDLSSVEDAVVNGFKMTMDRQEGSSVFDITHGQRFVLVDPDMKIRGFYETDKPGLDRLMKDVGLLSAFYQRKAVEALKAVVEGSNS